MISRHTNDWVIVASQKSFFRVDRTKPQGEKKNDTELSRTQEPVQADSVTGLGLQAIATD